MTDWDKLATISGEWVDLYGPEDEDYELQEQIAFMLWSAANRLDWREDHPAASRMEWGAMNADMKSRWRGMAVVAMNMIREE